MWCMYEDTQLRMFDIGISEWWHNILVEKSSGSMGFKWKGHNIKLPPIKEVFVHIF